MPLYHLFKLFFVRFIVIKYVFLIILLIPFNVNATQFSATEYVHAHAKYELLIELSWDECGLEENAALIVLDVLQNKKETLPGKLLRIWIDKYDETEEYINMENFAEIKLGKSFDDICTNLHSYVNGMLINSIKFK